ncbi:MAG: mechanosensitive ion channel family protein [Acidobacteriota bacterium]
MSCATWRSNAAWRLVAPCVLTIALSGVSSAQPAPDPASAQPAPKPAKDPLERETPRGTVRGFLSAGRSGQDEVAAEYLNLPPGRRATGLAHQLFVVLDARMPARLTLINDIPEGSRSNPLKPNEEIVAEIPAAQGKLEIVLDRVQRQNGPAVWLFSERTLSAIPAAYEEVTLGWGEGALPRLLTGTQFGGIRLLEWLCVLLGLPILYLVTVVVNKTLSPLVGRIGRRLFKDPDMFVRNALPGPARLLLLALTIEWLRSAIPLPLLVRQFWSLMAALVTIAGIVWLLILVDGAVEGYIRRRFPRFNVAGAVSLLRLGRRVVDLLVIVVGVLLAIRRLGIDPTPALAGLGVGGIAVALAAQKTLENVIAGASLIFDQVVRVGDTLQMDTVVGTVEHIGLRSTRIRTPDRTLVSVPNSQIANASLTTISARDKFWFHPVIGLRYETTPAQLHAVVDGIMRLLGEHPSVEKDSVRVRFFRLGPFSLDLDVNAYVFARDWNHFLEIQERLLFGVTDIISAAGTGIAFPSQTMYMAETPAARDTRPPVPTR